VSPQTQLQLKESVLLENLRRIGSLVPERVLPPVTGPAWGYRRRARFGVRDVPGKGRVLVGFRERLKPYVTDMRDCHTLHPAAARLIGPLSELIGTLSLRARLPQVEVAVADNATVLVLRVLAEPTPDDLAALRRFRDIHGVRLYLQRTDPAVPAPLDPDRDGGELWYELAGQELRITFGPTNFIQVNADINRKMVGVALDLLAPALEMRVLDLFCGVGNFTLPLARRARQVMGVDIEPEVLARARHNAALNGIGNVEFHAADLGQTPSAVWAREHYDLVLLDPPRTGAAPLMAPIAGMQPQRILYISCHPGTLARDAGTLVGQHGYRLIAAGALDMFPGTRHIESIALFARRG
jgi:23S rRNA (uracil1939-C5)-methyltransferase